MNMNYSTCVWFAVKIETEDGRTFCRALNLPAYMNSSSIGQLLHGIVKKISICGNSRLADKVVSAWEKERQH